MINIVSHIFLFLFGLNVSSKVEYNIQNADSTIKALHLRDSLLAADSVRIFEKQRKLKIGKKITFGALAAASAAGAIKFGIDTNGYPMLFLGIAAILFAIGLFRKSKTKTYEYYKQKEKKREKDAKFNKSWIYGFRIGLIGFAGSTLMILLPSLFLLAPLLYATVLVSIFFLIRGFKGKYDSKKQFRSRLILGILGVLMPFFPYLLIYLLLFGIGNFSGFR